MNINIFPPKLITVINQMDEESREFLLKTLPLNYRQKGFIASWRIAAILTKHGWPISENTIQRARSLIKFHEVA